MKRNVLYKLFAIAVMICSWEMITADTYVTNQGYVYLDALGWDTTTYAQLAICWTDYQLHQDAGCKYV